MAYKLLLIKTEPTYCECQDECFCEVELSTQELSLSELLRDHQLKQEVASLIAQAIDSGDDTVRNQLLRKGWINMNEIRNREEKLAAGKQFWMYKEQYNAVTAVKLESLTGNVVRMLATDDVHLVQSITKPSFKKFLSKDQKKVYDKEAARQKTERKKRVAAAKTRRENKKAKEIEKAKKVLAEAGET